MAFIEEPTGEFKHFTIKYGTLAEQMAEGFGTELKYINLSRTETKEGFQTLKTEIRENFQGLRAETNEGFETLRTEMKDEFESLRNEIKEDMNKSFQSMATKRDAISKNLARAIRILQEEFTRTRTELTRAVDNLARLVEAPMGRALRLFKLSSHI